MAYDSVNTTLPSKGSHQVRFQLSALCARHHFFEPRSSVGRGARKPQRMHNRTRSTIHENQQPRITAATLRSAQRHLGYVYPYPVPALYVSRGEAGTGYYYTRLWLVV